MRAFLNPDITPLALFRAGLAAFNPKAYLRKSSVSFAGTGRNRPVRKRQAEGQGLQRKTLNVRVPTWVTALVLPRAPRRTDGYASWWSHALSKKERTAKPVRAQSSQTPLRCSLLVVAAFTAAETAQAASELPFTATPTSVHVPHGPAPDVSSLLEARTDWHTTASAIAMRENGKYNHAQPQAELRAEREQQLCGRQRVPSTAQLASSRYTAAMLFADAVPA